MVNFDALMQPINPDHPSGDNLRLDPADTTFAQLETMRQVIDPEIDPGGTAKQADWSGVVKLAEEALTSRTKDLELAAIFTQGLVVQEGFAGLLTGLRFIKGLVSDFWETVHPGWDEGEIIEPIRARPLSWLGSSKDFQLAIKRVPLSAPIGDASHSWFDYEQSQRVDKAAMQSDQGSYQELLADGFITGEQWRGSLGGTPPERLEPVLTGLKDSLAELQALNLTCEEQFPEDPPYLLELRNLLEEILEYLESFQLSSTGTAAQAASPSAAEPSRAPTPAPVAASAAGGQGGPIASRDEAYRKLREVAEFLRRTEPHSPVPPLLDRAVRWGNMSFEKLFEDVVKNKDAQHQTRDLLGLDTESTPNKPVNKQGPPPVAGQSPKRMND